MDVKKTLTTLDLVREIFDNTGSPSVSCLLVEVGRLVCKFVKEVNETLVNGTPFFILEWVSSLVVKRLALHVIEFVEGIDLIFTLLGEHLLELLDLGARLVIELLELEDVIGNGRHFHCSVGH